MSTFGGSWIGDHARLSPDKIAVRDLADGQLLSYAEFDERIGRFAGALRDVFGVGRGDRVVLLSRSCVRAFEVIYACARLGAIVVPLNVRLSDPELSVLLADARPAVVAGEGELLASGVAAGIPALSWEAGYEQALAVGSVAGPVPLDADDPWIIVYTADATGLPNRVVLTHAGSAATMFACLAGATVTADSVGLTALPVWQLAGLNLFANPVLFAGGTVLVMRSFDPGRALALLTRQRERVTHFCGRSAHYRFMRARPGFATASFRPFFAGVAGPPVPAALGADWSERGVRLRTIYGISEAGSTVTMSPA